MFSIKDGSQDWVPRFGPKVWSQGLVPRLGPKLYTRVGCEDIRLRGTQCLVLMLVLRLGLQVGYRGKVPSVGPIPRFCLNARS
jgi:hypothetical protein